MARNPNPTDMVKNFQAAIGAAGAKYASGVARVTDNPCAKAASRVDDGTWAARTTAAAGRMSSRLKAVSMDQWKSAVSSYGASRYSTSAAKAAANYGRVASQIASAGAAASAAAESAGSDPVARFTAAMNATKAAWGRS